MLLFLTQIAGIQLVLATQDHNSIGKGPQYSAQSYIYLTLSFVSLAP